MLFEIHEKIEKERIKRLKMYDELKQMIIDSNTVDTVYNINNYKKKSWYEYIFRWR
jgi:hypothetical protein